MARTPHVLVVPYPAQGHMIPLFEFAHLLSTHAISITVVVTPKNLRFLQPFLSDDDSLPLRPLVLPFPSSPDIPPGIENSQDLPKGSFLSVMRAFPALSDPLLQWARAQPHPPTAIISDMFLGWTLDLARSLGIPRLVFYTSGSFAVSVVHSLWLNVPDRPADHATDELFPVPVPDVPGSPVFPWYQLSPIYRVYKESPAGSLEWLRKIFLANVASWGGVFNTFRKIEGAYLDHLSYRPDGGWKTWAVGPLVPHWEENRVAERGGCSETSVRDVVAWLDGRDEASVAYVCFGSQAELSDEQVAALSAALETSGVAFLWCVKQKKHGGPSQVPEGFEERVKERGMVLRGWAPQVLILNHRSVGCFLTHCGWNSTLEGLAAGVPLLTWPLYADQYMNEVLIVDQLLTGERALHGTNPVPDPTHVAQALVRLTRRDCEVRARSQAIKESAHLAVKGGGSSYKDLVMLVEELHQMAPLNNSEGENGGCTHTMEGSDPI
ncbi:flavonol 3-O-glucosyltransferase UGT89B1-like [Nymphaea colorata]|nr:flavonol 3-O-glucosyltransferase UGT89B1-like [Nymphaea colorata]